MKRKITVALLFCVVAIATTANAENILRIKYRPTPVDVDQPHFEQLDTSKSSWIGGAWYDASQQYMIINLSGTNYHYCGMDKATWQAFKEAESFGSAFNRSIKGRFDCRVHPVPQY